MVSWLQDTLVNAAIVLPPLAGLAYCAISWLIVRKVTLGARRDHGTSDRVLQAHLESRIENVRYIAKLISNGVFCFLATEYRYLAVFTAVAAISVGLAAGKFTALAYLVGAATSTAAGYIGITVAVKSNWRTTHECWRKDLAAGHRLALRSGSIASFSLTCMAVLTLYFLLCIFDGISTWESNHLWVAASGYSLGVSATGLFARVGGGIFMKAADIGADISGTSEYCLSEDDYRNPACIADNVGDNVGGIICKGSDLFGSLAGATCATLVFAGSSDDLPCLRADGPKGIAQNWPAMMFPLVLSSVGIATGLVTMEAVTTFRKVKDIVDVERNLRNLVIVHTLAQAGLCYWLAKLCLPDYFIIHCDIGGITPIHAVVPVWLGLLAGIGISHITEYYTSHRRKPVREIAGAFAIGTPTGVILGIAMGYWSCAIPVIILTITVIISHFLLGSYGVALAAVGMLSTMSMCLGIDAYDSIADNASGIAEMSGLSSDLDAREMTDVLGGAGAVGNDFALGSALLVSLALLHAFWAEAHIVHIDAMATWYFAGLLLGALLPYLLSAITLKAVGRAANEMVEECHQQFEKIIRSRMSEPDYDRCIMISTKASLRNILPLCLLAIGLPVFVGMLFGKICTVGLLQGALISGVLMAMSMINAGGAWDNAKKLVYSSGAKNSQHYRNAVIGDVVGDPLKDVSGPSLNVLIILSTITCLVFGNMMSRWSNAQGGPFWLSPSDL